MAHGILLYLFHFVIIVSSEKKKKRINIGNFLRFYNGRWSPEDLIYQNELTKIYHIGLKKLIFDANHGFEI